MEKEEERLREEQEKERSREEQEKASQNQWNQTLSHDGRSGEEKDDFYSKVLHRNDFNRTKTGLDDYYPWPESLEMYEWYYGI
jgi:hypothetical protein